MLIRNLIYTTNKLLALQLNPPPLLHTHTPPPAISSKFKPHHSFTTTPPTHSWKNTVVEFCSSKEWLQYFSFSFQIKNHKLFTYIASHKSLRLFMAHWIVVGCWSHITWFLLGSPASYLYLTFLLCSTFCYCWEGICWEEIYSN